MISRLCLAGEFAHDRLGASWDRALRGLGREVVPFDIELERARLGWPLRNRFTHRLTIRSYRVRRQAARQFNDELYRRVVESDAQALILHNGEFVFPEVLARIKARKVKVVIFHADNPLPPNYANRPESLPSAFVADLYLVWSERLATKLRKLGVAGAQYFPFAWDPEVFPYAAPPAEPWEGVVFVGGWDHERERALEKVATRFPLKIFGPPYWGERSRRGSAARRCWAGRALDGEEAAKVMRESALSLNILRKQHYIDGVADGMIMRHFEVPGAGGFLLSTRSGGATEVFVSDDTGAYFDGDEEMLHQIERHLGNSRRRFELVDRAHKLVSALHTYTHRLRALLDALETDPEQHLWTHRNQGPHCRAARQ